MAYTPINWQTGDTITAEKMNKMDNGWSVTTGATTLFEETVTVESGDPFNSGRLNYSDIINQDTVTVTFNGTDYVCNRMDMYGAYYYGGFSEQGPDFTSYPFCLESFDDMGVVNNIYTQSAGTYTVKLEARTTTCELSDEFTYATSTVANTVASQVVANSKDYRYVPTSTELFFGNLTTSSHVRNGYRATLTGVTTINSNEVTVSCPSPALEVTLPQTGATTFGATFDGMYYSFSTYSVGLHYVSGEWMFVAQSEQTYTDLEIWATVPVMETDDVFLDAVAASLPASGSFTTGNADVYWTTFHNTGTGTCTGNNTRSLDFYGTWATDTPSCDLYFIGGMTSQSKDGILVAQMPSSTSGTVSVKVINTFASSVSIAANEIEFIMIGIKRKTATTHYYLQGQED